MMHEYELVVLTKGEASESEQSKLVEQIKKLISAEKGEVVDVKDWGKRELAYKIKKNTHGVYTIFTFKGEPKTPQGLVPKLRLLDEILRFLVVRRGKEERKLLSHK